MRCEPTGAHDVERRVSVECLVESFDDLSEYNCPIDADILIDYMIQTGDGRGSEKLQSLLDNFLCIDDMD